MRLLLVEDDPMIGETVLDLLRAEHYAVDWVRDGDMADTALRDHAYDLVVLDLGLPRRDGLSVLRALRARKDRTPVLIATARDAKHRPHRRAGRRRRRLCAQALRPGRAAGAHPRAAAACRRARRARVRAPRGQHQPGHAGE
jgi:CheY-like chemotaxis protein